MQGQGLTLLPLLMLLGLHDEEQTVEREALGRAVSKCSRPPCKVSADGDTEIASALRREYSEMLAYFDGSRDELRDTYREEVMMRAGARAAARERLTALRSNGEIGDEAFHSLEAELDLIELGAEVRSRW